MPKIKCTAKKCVYNNDKSCTRNQIAVEKKAFCDSFEYMEKDYDIEVASFDEKSEPKDIWCDAVNCTYLYTGKCSASAISITGNEAEKSKETNCETFKRKEK